MSDNQASSYSNITRNFATNTKDLCTITTARDNQDDCQASVSQSWIVAMGTSLAGHHASSYATYTRDSLTARQSAIYCYHHHARASRSCSQDERENAKKVVFLRSDKARNTHPASQDCICQPDSQV